MRIISRARVYNNKNNNNDNYSDFRSTPGRRVIILCGGDNCTQQEGCIDGPGDARSRLCMSVCAFVDEVSCPPPCIMCP